MSTLRWRLHQLRRWLVYGFASALILLAVLAAIAGQVLPWVAGYPIEVAQMLSERIGQPVSLRAVAGVWERRGPRLELDGLVIGSGEARVLIDRAALQFNVFSGWLPAAPLTTLKITSPSLTIERLDDGTLRLGGFGPAKSQIDAGALLDRIGEVVLDDASLTLVDATAQARWSFDRVDARVRTQGPHFRFGLLAYRGGGQPLRLSGRIDRDLQGGLVYAAATELDLSHWLSDLPLFDWIVDRGNLKFQSWLSIEAGRIDEVTFDLGLSALAARHADGRRLAPASMLALRGRWCAKCEAACAERLVDSPAGQPIQYGLDQPGGCRHTLVIAGPNEQFLQLNHDDDAIELRAGRWPLGEYAEWLVALPVPAALRERLEAKALGGELVGLKLNSNGVHGSAPQIEAVLSGLRIDAFGSTPGLRGFDVQLTSIEGVWRAQLSAAGAHFEWPNRFPAALDFSLAGSVLAYVEHEQWRLNLQSMHLRGKDFDFMADANLGFDGGSPSLDLRVDVGSSPVAAAKKFWVQGGMPPKAIDWLDQALLGGEIVGGRMLINGDLDDWPFRSGEGRFEADAELRDLQLRFRPDWPPGEGLRGHARFVNDNFDGDFSGRVLGVEIERVIGRIEHYRDGLLTLDIEGRAPGQAMIDVLRESALWPRVQGGMGALDIGGRGEIKLRIDAPLKPDSGGPLVDGTVSLVDADLREANWGIALDHANGAVRFTERGVSAADIEVLYGGQSGRLGLAVGSFVEDAANRFEATLVGRFEPDTLLDMQPDLGWLKPMLAGASEFRIGVAVPAEVAVPSGLRVESDLVGTALMLPAPLRKAAAVRMPLVVDVGLAQQRSLDLRLGSLLHLSGSWGEGSELAAVAAFGEVGPIERPNRGIAVIGQAPILDVEGWSLLAAGGRGAGLLHSVDLESGSLDVLDRSFSETRLRFTPGTKGSDRVRLDGPGLSGDLELPAESDRASRGITAHFERLHWPAAKPGAAVAKPTDPAAVPPLHLSIDDMRFGDAALGATRLETYPLADGMRIERFSSRSASLDLGARGEWRRLADGERCDFAVEFTATDLGAMLQALGFSELVEGGQTLATLKARWPGSPSAFALEKLDGELKISVAKGRVPDVRPGAGRLLGLFSLTELPRRLALDFSDFFASGFAFNQIEGRFVLAAGNAVTEDLNIKSPAADIRIRGRTGLKSSDYDQTVEVLPRTGSVLPVVGALAGGPVGAALGAAAQVVLQTPFKQLTRTLYHVTGAWAEPKIEVIERGPARLSDKSDETATMRPK